jgi:hypothetical protein
MNDHNSPLLTEDEALRWLRLDEAGGPKDPSASLKRYRVMGLVRGVKIGRNLRYPVSELERFVEKLLERQTS